MATDSGIFVQTKIDQTLSGFETATPPNIERVLYHCASQWLNSNGTGSKLLYLERIQFPG